MKMNNILLSKVLFETDPANTSCVENDLYDEYDVFVKNVSNFIELPLLFEYYFSVKLNTETIDKIKTLYAKYDNVN